MPAGGVAAVRLRAVDRERGVSAGRVQQGREDCLLRMRERKTRMTQDEYIVREVLDEREQQDARWGQQNHTPMEWLAVLTEEVGEVSQEVLRNHFGGKYLEAYRAECIQVAAVAVAMVECLDRQAGAKT